MGTTLSKSHNSNGKAGILNHSCLPGPKLTGPQAHLVAITQEWNLDDGEGGLAATSQGWDRAPQRRQGVWQRREGDCKSERHFLPGVSVHRHPHPHRLVPLQD